MGRGTTWTEIRDAIAHSIGTATEAILILLLIGALSGTWLLAGIIPAFIHYGMMILQPSIFLFAACIVCAVLSLATGSSWGTVGTWGLPSWASAKPSAWRKAGSRVRSSVAPTSETKCRR